MKPVWLRHLEVNPEACQNFLQWIERERSDAQKAVNAATSWDAYLAARAKLEAYVAIELATRIDDREEREREAYRGRALRAAGGA